MALDSSAITSKLVSTLARAMVPNSAYILRGAAKDAINLDPNMIPGETYQFRAAKVTAQDFSANGTSLDDGVKFDTYELSIRSVGTALKPAKLQKALACGDFKELSKEVCVSTANKLAALTMADDFAKVCNAGNVSVATGTQTWKSIAKVSTALKAKFSNTVYGFAGPGVIGNMLGEGRNFQPISVEPQFGKDLNGSLYGMNEVRTVNFGAICINKYLTNTADVTWTAGSLSTATATGVNWSGMLAELSTVGSNGGEVWYIVAGGKLAWGYIPVLASLKTLTVHVASEMTITSTDKDKEYDVILMRSEGAQIAKAATQLLDGEKEMSDTVEGIQVALEKRPGSGSFETIYNFGVAMAAGLGDVTKARIVVCEVN